MGAFEVTQGQYEKVMGKNPSWHSPAGGGQRLVVDQDSTQFPVEQVSWFDAVGFCCRLSELPAEKAAGRRYRLPTEAEWEYACRGGQSTRLDAVKAFAARGESGFNMALHSPYGLPIAKAGSYPPNGLGLFDMRGNVFEWCSDWFAWGYYRRSPETDPQGPETGVVRVVRGADWRFTGIGCRYTLFDTEPWNSSPFLGFRVVCEQGGE